MLLPLVVLFSMYCSNSVLLPSSLAANILVMSPSLSPSLLMAMGRVADTLAGTGRHNVTVWIPEMRPISMSGTKLSQNIVRTGNVSDAFERMMAVGSPDPFEETAHSFRARILQDDSVVQWCEALVQRHDELEQLRAVQFDLVFYDLVELCLVGVAHHLEIPRQIWVSTGPIPDAFNWFFGIPQPLSIVPTLQEGTLLGPRMNIWERAMNIWEYGLALMAQWRLFRGENAAFQKYISPDFPQLEQLASTRIDLAFVIGDQFVDPALPTLSKVIDIGGLGLSMPTKPLKTTLLQAVESGPRGAVLFSFGSAIMDTAIFGSEKMANLFRAFAHFSDYAFVAKISANDTRNRRLAREAGNNIHLFDWVEQTDLLAHPNLRLFISHSGYNSMLESAIHGVPVLAIPLFFDQLRVAKSAEYRGFGRVLTKSDLLDCERIAREIGEMLGNPKYKNNALRLAKLHREKPNQPKEALVRWTEFVLVNGPLPELIPESAQISPIAYFCVDIAFGAMAIAVGTIWLCRNAFRWAIAHWKDQKAKSGKRPKKRLLKR